MLKLEYWCVVFTHTFVGFDRMGTKLSQLATLVYTAKLHSFTISASDHTKEESNKKKVFGATFEQLSWQKATFEKLFEKLRANFWEISRNFWKPLGKKTDESGLPMSLLRNLVE